MNKLLTKVARLALGLSLAAGVGVAIGSNKAQRTDADYNELYSADFTSVATHSYTQNKTFTLSNKSWTASVSQVNGSVFYLGCNSNNASKGVLNNNSTFSAVVTALRSADATYNTNYSTAHAYALLFENAYNSVTKVTFDWAGGNNAFQVYLFGYTGGSYALLDSENYATSGASVSGGLEWTGSATNYTKFAIVARPGATNSTATSKTLRAASFAIYETSGGACTHNWVAGTVHAATCTEDGYTEYECSLCHEPKNDDVVAALGHNFGDWIIDTAATCTTAGSKHRVCSRDASHTEVEAIPATGHNYVDHVCTVCGAEEPIQDVLTSSVIPSAAVGNATNSWGTASTFSDSTGAVYTGRFMGVSSSSFIGRLNDSTNGYIYTSTIPSGLRLKSVSIESMTASKTVGVYAQNSAYTAAPSDKNTAIGTITSDSLTFNFASNSDYKAICLRGHTSATEIGTVTITYELVSSTWSVTYDGNNETSGTVPTDNTQYSSSNNSVTVLGNTGNLTKTHFAFGGWTDGEHNYSAGQQFTISGNVTLSAIWNLNLPTSGTENDPYSVEDAKIAIDENAGTSNVYASGIVSEIVEAYSSQYGNISYNISSDGLTSGDQLEIYRGKSFNGDNFTSADDIQVGDVVVVYGNLMKHNDTYEFAQNSRLISLRRAGVAALTSIAITGSMTKTSYYTNDSWNPGGFTVTAYYSDSTSDDVTSSVTWTYSPEKPSSTSTTSVVCTATYSENGVTVNASSESQSVSVTTAPVVTFGRVTSNGVIATGDKVILLNQDETYGMGKYSSGNNVPAHSITVSDHSVSSDDLGDVEVYTVGDASSIATGLLYLFDSNGNYLYAASSSSNHLKTSNSSGTYGTNGAWSISFTNAVLTIIASESTNHNLMRYNPNGGSPMFSCYASNSTTGSALTIYKQGYTPVADKVLDSLSMTGTLTKTAYFDNESFDPSGLSIWANFTDSTTYPAENVTEYVVWNSLTAGDTSVEGSYTLGDVTETIIVSGITVTEASATPYTKISSNEQLWPGQEVLIAQSTESGTLKVATHYNGTGNNLSAVEMSQSGSIISTTQANVVFTLGQVVYDSNDDSVLDSVAWTIFDGTYYLYDAGTSGNNHLKGKTTLDSSCYWNFSLSEGVVTITSVENTAKPEMRYNSGSSIVSCYAAGGQAAITLYVKDTNSDGTSAAAGFVNAFMHMDANVTGQCTTYYPIAKVAWGNLSSTAKAKVASTQSSAYQRLNDWAAAHSESIDANYQIVASKHTSLLNINKESSKSIAIIVIISMVSVTAIGGYFFVRRRKEN